MDLISLSYVNNFGWTGKSFIIKQGLEKNGVISLTVNPNDTPVEITNIVYEDNSTTIYTKDFNYRGSWKLTIGGHVYTRKDAKEELVDGLEKYEAINDGKVIYRLYTPKVNKKRPLLLYLHGGGNGGTDNITHIAADYGPIQFASMYPDFYIMAPQAPQGTGNPFKVPMDKMTFKDSDQVGPYGWTREYLSYVCDIIRQMIKEGKVDENRVYVTGLSMGGAGTLRAMSVGAGLFTACAPVCPSMTPETFAILKGLKDAKIWISTAYVDHTVYRHKYIVDGIIALKDAGNKNAFLTLYSPEELEAYGIATDPTLDYKAKFGQNHMSWVLTYHNEYGIMSWLTQQTK